MVVLVCAFMVISIAPTLCQVSFSQGSSTAEPLSVDSTIDYNIPITNEGSGTWWYSVTLKLGPDKDNTSIFLEQTKSDIFVDPHQTRTVTFRVNFHDSQINQGEFNRWLTDKSDARIWEKAWYHAEISEFREQHEPLEDYSGRPRLMKTFFEYSNAEVSPKQGTGKDSYTYKVTVIGSYKDNITLQVSPTQNGPWTDFDTQEYANPGVLQTLSWNNKSLGFDFNAAHYRFKGIKPSNTFDGPFWPVTVDYRNESLNPARGLSSTPFNYSIEVNSTKKIEVGLNVFDIGSKTYKPAGRQSYTNVSQWQKLEWSNVDLGAISGSEGRSNYYFGFYYVGSEAPFLTTYDRLKQYYPGPDIVRVEFVNATVIPTNGSMLTPYAYTVDIRTALPEADVELQTSDPGSSIWNSRGVAAYDGSNRGLRWDNVKIDGGSDGLARFRFICGESYSDIYKGPRIGSAGLQARVKPYNGSLYFTNPLEGQIARVYTYNFEADVNKTQVGEPVDIGLELFDPVAQTWIKAGSQSYDPSRPGVSYSVNFAKLPFKGPFLGEMKYRFVSKDKILGEFPGPYIDVNLRNESVVVVGSKITYRVEVRSSLKKVPVALDYTPDNNIWSVSDTKLYESDSQAWKILEWKEYPKYFATEFEVLRGQT